MVHPTKFLASVGLAPITEFLGTHSYKCDESVYIAGHQFDVDMSRVA